MNLRVGTKVKAKIKYEDREETCIGTILRCGFNCYVISFNTTTSTGEVVVSVRIVRAIDILEVLA